MKTFFLSSLLITTGLLMPFSAAETADAAETPASVPATPLAVTVEVKVGEHASLLLNGNPTTGYLWEVADKQGDAATAETRILPPAQMKEDKPPLCGGPSPTELTFTGVKPGKTTVTMEYKRPWEKGEPAMKRLTFEVIVHPAE